MSPDAATPGEPSEQRLRRLEDALANLQNTQWLAEDIAQRVTNRIQESLGANGAALPLARPADAPALSEPVDEARSWFLLELIRDTRAMVRMFFDRGYRVNLLTWFVVLLTLPVILLSHWWFGWVPLVGTYVDKVFDLVVAYVAFKALSREVRRYQRLK